MCASSYLFSSKNLPGALSAVVHGQGDFAVLPRRQVKHQAGGGIGIQPAVRFDDATLGCGQLLAAVDHRADNAQWPGLLRSRPHNVDAQFGRGVARPAGIKVRTAQPTAESGSAAYQPPCTVPSGL